LNQEAVLETNMLKSSFKRNYFLLMLGRTISEIGTSIFKFGLSLYVLDVTKSAFAYSMVLFFSTMAGVITNVFAASISDKYNKKNIMIISDILSAIVICIFSILCGRILNSMIILIVYVIIISSIQSLFELTISSAIPNLFCEDDITKVNSSLQSILSLLGIFGAIVGSFIYSSFGITTILIIDGVSFGITGLMEMFLIYKDDKRAVEFQKEKKYINNIKEIFMFFKQNSTLIFLVIFVMITGLVFGSLVLLVLPYITYNELNLSSLEVSLIQAGWFIGTILGAILVSKYNALSNIMKKIFLFLAIQSVSVMFWVFPNILNSNSVSNWVITGVYMTLLIILGIFNSYQIIPITTFFQIYIPTEIRARFFGIFNASILIASSLGNCIYGILLENFNWSIIIFISGIITIVYALFGRKGKKFGKYSELIDSINV